MGVGHVAVGIAAARLAPRLNVGWLVFASLLADFLLGLFAAFGLESAHVPDDYGNKHYLTFTFPYSHGLLSLAIWSLLLGAVLARFRGDDRRKVLITVAAVAFSHYALDVLVHVVGLPIAGHDSPKLGLGLWQNMPLELAVETLMTAVGTALFWSLAAGSPRSRYGIAIFAGTFCALTWGQLATTEPPRPSQLVGSWIISPLVLALIAYGIDRKRVARAAA